MGLDGVFAAACDELGETSELLCVIIVDVGLGEDDDEEGCENNGVELAFACIGLCCLSCV